MNDIETTTDCRSEEGITVGLIDGMMAIARVLVKRNLSGKATREALRDFGEDEDIHTLMRRVGEITD